MEYYRKQKPTSKDMTKEEAAEIGVRELWNVCGASITFSRYDKAILGIRYDSSYQYTLAWIKQIENKASSKQKSSATDTEATAIIPDTD